MKPITIVSAGLLSLACGHADSDTPKSSPPYSPAAQQGLALTKPDGAIPALYEAILALGDTRSAVRARLGTPRGAATEPTPNRHDAAQMDTAVHWRFGDMEFWFLVAGGQDFLLESRVLPNHAAIADRITALATVAQAEAVLGRPSWSQQLSDTTVIGYAIPQEEPGAAEDLLKLYYVAGQLKAVGAAPYVD